MALDTCARVRWYACVCVCGFQVSLKAIGVA